MQCSCIPLPNGTLKLVGMGGVYYEGGSIVFLTLYLYTQVYSQLHSMETMLKLGSYSDTWIILSQ